MSVPIFENILFRITMFGGVAFFIYYILDINYKEIKKSIKNWILYIQVIEMPQQKEKRKSVYDKITLYLSQCELQGDIYIDKFKNMFNKTKSENNTEELVEDKVI